MTTFPLNLRTDIYKYFSENTLNCHWHEDFEMGIIMDGVVDFYVNDTCIQLKEGDGFFVNSNVLHMSYQAVNDEKSKDAVMYVLTFPASLIASCADVYTKYFQPIKGLEGFTFSENNETGAKIKATILQIKELNKSVFGYELECQKSLCTLWLLALEYISKNTNLVHSKDNMRQAERMKNILSYIHGHYSEKITADDIAHHVNVSRGECFRCFKQFMNKKLVEYINEYRLQRATELLRNTEKPIIDISNECGFDNTSYFGKIFKQMYYITPHQYRKAHIWTHNSIKNINNYDYEYYRDSGNGKMIITTNANNGSFLCEWSNSHNIMFRSGKKFINRDKTHQQMGNITLQYDAHYNTNGSTYLCVYGWTVDPLIEWYIIECYDDYMPMRDAPLKGVHKTNGDTYNIFHVNRINQPSIIGISDFNQYWSIRTVGQQKGFVDVTAHFKAWEKLGLKMGRISEVALSVESMWSSGTAFIKTNIIEISAPQTP